MNRALRNTRKGGLGDFLLGLVQIILYPRRGWEDASDDRYNAHDLLLFGLLPYLGVVSLTSLCDAFFYSSVTIVQAVIKGVIDFTGYFISIYICEFILSWGLKNKVHPMGFSQNSNMTLVIYSVATMATMTLLDNIFPADLALFSFLPLYVIYILWGSADFMLVPEGRKPYYLGVVLISVFLPPYILSYCLSLFL